MEEKKELKTFMVDYKCPKCKTGYLRSTGKCLMSNPPKYPHTCNNPECEYVKTFKDKKYPYIDYEEI